MKQSLCQTCYNYIGCPWHENFTPRDDWEATPTKVKMCDSPLIICDSFLVEKCPDYKRRDVQGVQVVTIQNIADMLGVSWRTAMRWIKSGTAYYKLKARGYVLIIDHTRRKYAVYILRKVK